MNASVREVAAGCRSRVIFVDTNLLLLYLIGLFNRPLISRFKRTQRYSPDQFDGLAEFLGYFDKIVSTPHVLTEISNFSGQLHEPARSAYFLALAGWTPNIFDERQISAATVAAAPEFVEYGLTDAGISLVCGTSVPFLTDDGPLAAYLAARGVRIVYFNTIQP